MTGGVVIAVPTFRRPQALGALLDAVAAQAAGGAARVLVIDNDPEASGRAIAEAAGAEYVVEPARGLAAVRNRALDEAADDAALVFIDDDEVPTEGWLAALTARWRESGAAAVSGPVESVFPAGYDDEWITAGGFFQRVRFPDGTAQPVAPTNNLLMDLGFVREHGLRFDSAFGLSGGEDILFTKQLVRNGGRIVSCAGAIVLDPVASERLTREWVLRRAYRVGVTAVRTEIRLGGGLPARARGVAGGAARMVVGTLRRGVGTVLRSARHRARGARAVWRGWGMVAGSFGHDYREYALR